MPLEIEEKEGRLGWVLDMEKLKAAITPKTALFFFNHPHNPSGKCFTK